MLSGRFLYEWILLRGGPCPHGVPKLQENPFFYLNDRGFAREWQKVPSVNKKHL
jgi:hypothetical protein